MNTPRPATVHPFERPGTRYGVFTAEGKLLGIWNTREQAESFIYRETGRYVREVEENELPCQR